MSAYYRSNSYERGTDYPDYSRSQDRKKEYLKTQGYPVFPGSLNNPDSPSPRSNAHSAGSRTNPDLPEPIGEPDYPGSPNSPDYHRPRNNPYSEDYRTSPDYHKSLPELDYIEYQSDPHHLGSLREPDYPGAKGNRPSHRADFNHSGSRRNLGFGGSRISPYTDSLGEPDYPGTENQPNSPHSFGDPDYPRAVDHQNSPDVWGTPDYPGAKDGHGYSSSETWKMTKGGNGPLGLLGGENENYPENIEMTSVKMANPYGHSLPGAPGNGYVNPAFMGENSPLHDNGTLPSSRCDWHESSQGQKLIASLIPMTSRERIKTIRNQPRTMEEKRKLRNIVDKEKSKQSHRTLRLKCCAQYLNSFSRGYRRSKNSLSELLSSISLWQKTLKVIGGKFGTSVLSYFNFLRWLLKFNIFSFVLNFSFIIIPQLTVAERNTQQFTGQEFLTGAGYFTKTVMYYGFYTNSTIRHGSSGAAYDMQLAYIFTVAACLVICFFSLLYSMATYFRNNFINPHIYSRGIAKLIFCWDFTVTHVKAVKLRQKNLSTEIRENLSEILHENVKFTFRQRLARFSAHLAAWLVSTGMAGACCAAVYYLAQYNSEFLRTHRDPWAVLLLPFVVSCINLIVPRLYSMFGLVEKYEMPRHEVYNLLIRNILLKMSVIGILCHYWLNTVALSNGECWETVIGQEIYRLLLMDFMFSLADSFLGEFLRRIIGMRFITSLGLQEFDIARNVLELIYAQTLVWIGIFFCPLLPFIQMITLFIMFYVKNISLMMNFQPPSKAWRASQMITVFIFLLFFPSFTGVLCTLAITIWRLKPSANCGPFRGLPLFIQSIYLWIDTLRRKPGYMWVVWIYQNLIDSVHFFFILTLIVLIITYLYWQITEGRKVMIRLLHEQIINEGKDKMFLIEKLTKLQDMEKRANPSALILERREMEQQGPVHLGECSAAADLRFRRSTQEDNLRA
ncbi:transmembrane channel-like protein 5 isoform X1 [Fukomys damarensis]|uniref:transmembrane channel-like protein 5 isoform X1 n=1 Tax=Fukomys damarensis TaxID=885580 RepID=UPI00053FA1D0|nr:transmembrane channel-like protein 5 isoform X1 [Fukomys damarensis]